MVKSNSSSEVEFPGFLEDNWRKMVMFHSKLTALCCLSGTVATCSVLPRKQAAICLGQFSLDSALFEIPIQSTAVNFGAYTRNSTIHHLSVYHRRISKHSDRIFFSIYADQSTRTFFFERLKNCVRFNVNIFFLSQMVMQYCMYSGPTNA